MAEGELMDNYNATQFLSGIDVTSEKSLYLNENVGPQEHRNLFDEPSRCFKGIIFASIPSRRILPNSQLQQTVRHLSLINIL